MIKVLFTGGGGAGNEALFRLLGQRYMLHFGDSDVLAIDPSIPEGQRHQVPWASDPDYVVKIIELCKRLEIDLLIPGVDEELLALARSSDDLAPTLLLLPHTEYVETMLDKMHMIRSLSAKKIPVPFSKKLSEELEGMRFPCISKPRNGRGSRGVSVISTFADAISLKSTLGSLAEKMLVQEKIEGIEYTVQMVANAHSRLCAVVPVKVGLKRGITIRAETDAEPLVLAACKEIHRSIPTVGCYNIQLMLTPEGSVFPFEINPRISTTLCLVVAAGIDPIAIFLEHVHPENIQPFTAGVVLRRYWTNILSN